MTPSKTSEFSFDTHSLATVSIFDLIVVFKLSEATSLDNASISALYESTIPFFKAVYKLLTDASISFSASNANWYAPFVSLYSGTSLNANTLSIYFWAIVAGNSLTSTPYKPNALINVSWLEIAFLSVELLETVNNASLLVTVDKALFTA